MHVVAIATLFTTTAVADQAADLLNKVEQTYQNAKSGHFKAVRASETAIGGGIGADIDTDIEIAFVKPENKVLVAYDYGHGPAGKWIRVSDGKTLTGFRTATKQRKQQPASANDIYILNGTFVDRFSNIAENVTSAKMLDSASVPVNGKNIDCNVVEVHYKQGVLPPNTEALPTTYWIDKQNNVVLKETSGTKSTKSKSQTIRTLTFKLAEIDQPVPASVFTVNPGK